MPPLLNNTSMMDTSDNSSRDSAWTKRFAGLTALVQPALPKTDLGRQSSLHVLFSKSFKEESDYDTDTFCAEEALTTLQRVQDSVDGILHFLQEQLPSRSLHVLARLQTLLSSYQYTSLLKQAEEYTEYLILKTPSLLRTTDVLDLFALAWTSLHEYAQDRHQQIHKAHSDLRLQQWQEQVTRFCDEKDQEDPRRQQRRIRQRNTRHLLADLESCPMELDALKQQSAAAVRFRMECQKHVVLTEEWTRCIKAQVKVLRGQVVVDC